jgi:SAM-dependent methyltransferase
MQLLLRDTRSMGWEQAVCDLLQQAGPTDTRFAEEEIHAETRAGWKYGISVHPDSAVLDFDCGWGPVSLNLARHVRVIYGTGRTYECLALLKERASQRGLENIRCVQTGDSFQLPFPDHFFDLVCLRRGLEAAVHSLPGAPRLAVQRLLREFRRVLKPAGQLFTCVHNRLAWRYFLGHTDEYASLPYVTLLPRALASLYCRLRFGRRQHTHLRTLLGTRRVFRQAGFLQVSIDALFPNGPNFSQLIPLEDVEQLDSCVSPTSRGRRLGKWLLVKSRTLPLLAPAFGVVASPTGGMQGMLGRLVGTIRTTQQRAYHAVTTRIPPWGGTFVLVLKDQQRPAKKAVLKVGVHEAARDALRRGGRNVRTVAPTLGEPHLVPRILEEGSFEGNGYLLQEHLPGCDGHRLLAQGWTKRQLLDSAWDLLDRWMKSTRRTARLDEPAFQEWILYRPHRWQQLFGSRTAEVLQEVTQTLHKHCIGRDQNVVSTHGDYHFGNLLFDESTGALTGVIDWDSANQLGNPLVDAMMLSDPDADLCFSQDEAAVLPVTSLVDKLELALRSWGDHRLLRVRSEYGLNDVDAAAALFRLFLSHHQSSGSCFQVGVRKWVEALRVVVARAVDRNGHNLLAAIQSSEAS